MRKYCAALTRCGASVAVPSWESVGGSEIVPTMTSWPAAIARKMKKPRTSAACGLGTNATRLLIASRPYSPTSDAKQQSHKMLLQVQVKTNPNMFKMRDLVEASSDMTRCSSSSEGTAEPATNRTIQQNRQNPSMRVDFLLVAMTVFA